MRDAHLTSRRRWLAGVAALGAYGGLRSVQAAPPGPSGGGAPIGGGGIAQLEAMQIDLPQLQYPGRWNPRPGAMRELGVELRLRTRLEPVHEPSVVQAGTAELFTTPFLYVAGDGSFPALGTAKEASLRRFVDLGGLLVFDDASGGADRGFRKEIEALVARLVPGSTLEPVGEQHVIYRSFYIVDEPQGRTRASDRTFGIQEEGRLKVLFLPNDLGGALARNEQGLHAYPCQPGGPTQREWATRLAINILLYATCTDYKSDRAHVETLRGNRRRRSPDLRDPNHR